MTTYNHDAIVTGETNAPSTLNTRLGDLDGAIGDASVIPQLFGSSAFAKLRSEYVRALAAEGTINGRIDNLVNESVLVDEVVDARAAGNVGSVAATLRQRLDWAFRNMFPAEAYGLTTGMGQSSGVHAANTTAIANAITAAGMAGGGVVLLPGGDVEINRLAVGSLPDGITLQGAGRGATRLHFMQNTAGGAILLNGVSTLLASSTLDVQAEGAAVSIGVADTTGFAAGQLIWLRDTTDVGSDGSWPFEPRPGLDNGEWTYVLAVDTPNGELDLHTSIQSSQYYPVTATEVKAPTMSRNLRICDLTVSMATADDAYGGISVGYVDGLVIDNVEVVRAASAGLSISTCVNVTISNCLIWGGDEDPDTATGYGIQTNQCQWVDIWGCKIYKQRRAIDLSGGWPSRYVNIFGNSLWGSYTNSTWSIVGTHGTAEYCMVSNNILIGAGTSGGVYVRGNAMKITGNTFIGCNVPILLTDGATHEIVGNVVDGRKRWTIPGSGRFTEEFVRINSPRAQRIVLQGNVTNLETVHCRFNAGAATAEVWINDTVTFRSGAPGTQDVLLVQAGSVTASINSTVRNHDNIVRADGGTVSLVNRNGFNGQRTRTEYIPATAFGLSGAAASTLGSAGTRISTLLFAEGDDDYANLSWRLPANYNSENIVIYLWWAVSGTPAAANVVWRGYVRGISDGGLTNSSGHSLTVTTSEPAAANTIKKTTLGTVTAAGATLAAGDVVRIEIRRNSAEGADTSTLAAHLVGVELSYTENITIGI